MIDKLLKVDSTKDNLVDQIQDLQERISELERFALTSQDIKANKIAVGLESVLADLVDGDIATIPWTDYSDTSTIVGWTSTTTESIYYKKIGKLVYVQYYIRGTSDDTTTTFTLPYTQDSGVIMNAWARTKDDGGAWSSGLAEVSASGSTCSIFPATSGGSWTASGDKGVLGQFWFETA